MEENNKIINELIKNTEFERKIIEDKETARLFIHHNKIISSNLVEGLIVKTEEIEDGIKADITITEGTAIKKPVHMCFGMLHERGLQKIILDVKLKKHSSVFIYAHCIFPNAIKVEHIMDAKIDLEEGANYSYFERHVHGENGGVYVYPKAVVNVLKNARFKTEFELIKGLVGLIEIDYSATCDVNAVMDMSARISGSGNDIIKIKETGYLKGENSVGVLTSKIALRKNAKAEVYNKIVATAPYARGHVDCKEIVQDNSVATAVPVVEVHHPKARVTHEAAIGSVDSKQLETLMSRGLSEEKAVELIINSLTAMPVETKLP